jgi:hypothetical protein
MDMLPLLCLGTQCLRWLARDSVMGITGTVSGMGNEVKDET